MKGLNFAFTAACAAAVMMSAGQANAQDRLVFGGIGSSAQYASFNTAAQGYIPGAITSVGNATAHDPTTTAADQGGAITVVYNGAPGNRDIYYYIKVDSGVGVREFYNKATVSGLVGMAPALPADVTAAIVGQGFTAGITDTLPQDALNAANAALFIGYGDGATNPGPPVTDDLGFGDPAVQIVPFALGSRPTDIHAVGAVPVLVFVNTSLNGADDLGGPALTTIANGGTGTGSTQSGVVAKIYDGTLARTRDLFFDNVAHAAKPLRSFQREPISGTYVTFEQNVPNTNFANLTTQEAGVDPFANNPLDEPTAGTRGGRRRAIGTGSLVKAVNTTANSISYAFWGNGNFVGKAANTKYLAVDGVDPLGPNYTNGAYPAGIPSFDHILDGTYPIWSLQRALLDTTATYYNANAVDGITGLGVVAAATGLAAGTDYVNPNRLHVFHSHYGAGAHNGNIAGRPEAGADAGGTVFTTQADIDSNADGFGELLNFHK